MRIFIKNVETGLFLNAASEWGPWREAYDFRTPGFAIDLCMMRQLRNVRIIVDSGNPAHDLSLEVHGSEQISLAAAMTRNEELRERQRILSAELSAVQVEQKERKKQFRFKRKGVGSVENQTGL